MRLGARRIVVGAALLAGACGPLWREGRTGPDLDGDRVAAEGVAAEDVASGGGATPGRRRPAASRARVEVDTETLARLLADGRVDAADCEPDALRAAAAHLFDDVDWRTDERSLLARLDLARRMGPDGAGAIEGVLDWGGRTDATWAAARATLDAIDPGRTLRVPALLAASVRGTAGREMPADACLWDVGPAVIPALIDVLDGRREGSRVVAAEVLAEFDAEAAAALPALRRVAQGDDTMDTRAAAAAALFRVSEGREVVAGPLVAAAQADRALRAEVAAARPDLAADPALEIDPDLRRLRSGYEDVSRAAMARLLARPDGDPALAPALVAGIAGTTGAGDHDVRERRSACEEVITALGPRAAGLVPDLLPLLASPQRAVRDAAADALAATGDRARALPALRAALVAAVAEREAAAAREAPGPPPDAAERLPSDRPTDGLVRAVASFGADQVDLVLGALVEALGREHDIGGGTCGTPSGRRRRVIGMRWAAAALGDLGDAAAPAAPALVRALASEEVAEASIAALARIGRPAAAPLRVALADPDVRVRGSAAVALLGIDPEVSDAIPVLRDALATPESVHHHVWLRLLGPSTPTASPALRAAEAHAAPAVRRAAGVAAWRISGDPERALAAIRSSLATGGDETWGAVRAMDELGPAAAGVVPDLARRLADDGRCGTDEARLLADLHGDARIVVPAMASVIAASSSSGDVERACRVLGVYGPDAADAVPVLASRLASERWHAATYLRALGAIGPAAAPALPEVRAHLRDFSRSARDAARDAVARIEGR